MTTPGPTVGPFSWLDPPATPTINQPPALPGFTDGLLVRQGDLNNLCTNLTYLQQFVLGGSQGGSIAKPMTILSAITPNVFTSGAATVLLWDTVIVDNVNAWGKNNISGDAHTINVQKEGFYRINFQCGNDTASSNWNAVISMFILVNGSDVANNSVLTGCWTGNNGSLEVTVPLANTASIQVAYEYDSTGLYAGTSCNSLTNFGGARLEVEWIAPTIPVTQTRA
jgi:hypothetical protein